MTHNTFSFKVTTTSMWFFKIGSFPTYFTRIPPPPLLLGLGCQPGLREAKTTMSVAISFRSWLLWYFRLSMLPLQLWIHFSKSLEISHGEDRDKRESDLFIFCSVRAWKCRTLTWVFISIRNWSCNYIFTRISHEEDRDKRESDLFIFCLVRVWRCSTLTWVLISIRNWSCN